VARKPFYLDYEEPDQALSDNELVDDKQVLSDENDWTCSWDKLPKTDVEGNPYYYSVEETAVMQNGKDISGQYTTTYSNNEGIQYGQMVITNTAKEDEITLPSTGGMGTWIFRALGIISIGIGIEILLFIKRKIEIGGKGL
jgi:LPXTG-motif cell wall-anchored protein